MLNDHPPRMAGLPQLQYWWNLGGWSNTRSQVEAWGGGKARANSNHTIDTDSWYEIKIVNTSTGYTLFLDEEEVATMDDAFQDGHGRIGLATWNTTACFDDVLVYGSNGPSGESVFIQGKLPTRWAELRK